MSDPPGVFYEIAPGELADWLVQEGGERWWTLDGEDRLTSSLSFLPCPGQVLANAFRCQRGRLYVLAPPGKLGLGGVASSANFGDLGFLEGGARIFQLAWETNTESVWELVEDTTDDTTCNKASDVAE